MSSSAGIFHTHGLVKSSIAVLAPCAILSLCAITSVSAAETAGWRTDGSGKYPTATPPTEWSATKNVIWSTPMPSKSNASPVLLGGNIYVCSEPATLLCINADDGKIVWQKTSTIEEATKPEDAEKVKLATETAGELEKAHHEMQRANNQAKKDPTNADAQKKADEAKAKVAELTAKLEPVKGFAPPPAHGFNGYTSSTPLTDGKNVFVVFGSGVVACYDLKGTRVWIKKLENPRDNWGQSSSPALAGDKLLVHLTNLTALNAATGETAWTAKVLSRFGTPAIVKIGDTEAVLTPAGDTVRVSDGKVLASKVAFLTYSSPLVQDNIAYFIDETGGKALKLPEKIVNDTVTPEVVWTNAPVKDRYYASSLLNDGLLYSITQKGDLSVFDAKTGVVVYEKKLDLGGGIYYPSITMAGKNLYVSSDNGTTVVLEPGREYKELFRNTLENFTASPVFDGKRMYIRGQTKLFCIGAP